jgi:hypothetical protein
MSLSSKPETYATASANLSADPMKLSCELTDTFGGEANYSWVRRADLELPDTATPRQQITAAKAALGLTGCRCVKSDLGDLIELRPSGSCTVAFISFAS